MLPPVILSPHCDDACFSLGFTLTRHAGAHLVDLYTRTDRATGARAAEGRAGVEATTQRRRAEDAAFAARLDLRIVDLDLPEATLRSHTPFDLHGIADDAATLDAALVPLLQQLATLPGSGRRALYCPLGVGNHRDHVATLMVVVHNHLELQRHFAIRFYEDLPYAAAAARRVEAVGRLQSWIAPARPLRHAEAMSAAQFAIKMELAALYQSQLNGPPDPACFVPAAGPSATPHEAWWDMG
jgi:hypothetical protein